MSEGWEMIVPASGPAPDMTSGGTVEKMIQAETEKRTVDPDVEITEIEVAGAGGFRVRARQVGQGENDQWVIVRPEYACIRFFTLTHDVDWNEIIQGRRAAIEKARALAHTLSPLQRLFIDWDQKTGGALQRAGVYDRETGDVTIQMLRDLDARAEHALEYGED